MASKRIVEKKLLFLFMLAGKAQKFVSVVVRSALVETLSTGDKECLIELVEASKVMNQVWAHQMWQKGPEFLAQADSELDHATALYKLIQINRGPWSELDNFESFIPDSSLFMKIPNTAPPGGNFYPEDMTKDEFTTWINSSPIEKSSATDYYTFIRRDESGNLAIVPYSTELSNLLSICSAHLLKASSLCSSESLRNFLVSRAHAFSSNDYYPSSLDWLKIDSPISVTIGADFIYHDRLFGYKASYEAMIGLRDAVETEKLVSFVRFQLFIYRTMVECDPKQTARVGKQLTNG